MSKFYKWTVEIEVAETWVEDGFDITDKNILDRLGNLLPYAYGHEFRGKVIAAPSAEEVSKCQGYSSVEKYLKARG